MRILVTGGAGFIGSALVRHLIGETDHDVLNFDKLTYAGSPSTVAAVAGSNRYQFVQGDVCDAGAVRDAIRDFRPDVITHLAAESHVDRSIDAPDAFIQTLPIATADYPTPARRPANSLLDHQAIRDAYGIVPRDWRAALDDILDELLGTPQ